MPRSFLFLATALLLFAGWRCGNQAAGPAPPPPSEPDTTSHDFTWTTYTLGDGQSYLQDVYAVNDTDVWAVGEIYLKDSTGKLDLKMYNAIHWDGKMWKPQRVFWHYQGQEGISALNAVSGFSSSDVWVAPAPAHWDGVSWTSHTVNDIATGTTYKIWGRSPDDVYFVGSNGSIMHYIPWIFQKMESRTTTDLLDISGVFKGKIYACGGMYSGIVLEYDGARWSEVDSLSDSKIGRWSLWADEKFFCVGGHDLRYIDTKYGDTLRMPPKDILEGGLGAGLPIVTEGIHGSDRRNVFAVGSWQYVIHYNGKSWKWYDALWDLNGPTQYGVSATANSVFIVGENGGRATILVGRRK